MAHLKARWARLCTAQSPIDATGYAGGTWNHLDRSELAGGSHLGETIYGLVDICCRRGARRGAGDCDQCSHSPFFDIFSEIEKDLTRRGNLKRRWR
jgi:hypothetical protein